MSETQVKLDPDSAKEQAPNHAIIVTSPEMGEQQALIPAHSPSQEQIMKEEGDLNPFDRDSQSAARDSAQLPPIGVTGAEQEESVKSPLHKALSDPASPLYRSLSEIPKNLPPVRVHAALPPLSWS